MGMRGNRYVRALGALLGLSAVMAPSARAAAPASQVEVGIPSPRQTSRAARAVQIYATTLSPVGGLPPWIDRHGHLLRQVR